MKLLKTLMIVSLAFSLRAMQGPKADLDKRNEEDLMAQTLIDIYKLNLATKNSEKPVLRCRRCKDKLMFQNNLDLENAKIDKPILCMACHRELSATQKK